MEAMAKAEATLAIAPRESHPLDQGHPPEWASGWGHDRFGVFAEFTIGEVVQRLRWIPPGRFLMGSPETESGRFDDEGPQIPMTIAEGFWLFDTPVSQALWMAVLTENPSQFQDPDRPVERVSWHDAQNFAALLNERLHVGQYDAFSLPSEAEWEYACRADTRTAIWTGAMTPKGDANAPELDPVAWYAGNSGQDLDISDGVELDFYQDKQYPADRHATRKIAQKEANPWGLYDMLGNVWEWCEDAWADTHDGASPAGLPRPASQQDAEAASRVLRGGSWRSNARSVRAACRYEFRPDGRYNVIGFRLARGLVRSSSKVPPEAGQQGPEAP